MSEDEKLLFNDPPRDNESLGLSEKNLSTQQRHGRIPEKGRFVCRFSPTVHVSENMAVSEKMGGGGDPPVLIHFQ